MRLTAKAHDVLTAQPATIVDTLSRELGPTRAVLLTRDPSGEWRAEAPRLERVRVVRERRGAK